MGRIPSGLSQGVITSFGDYDQCLSIKSINNYKSLNNNHIYGKYCLVKPYIPFNDFKQLQEFNGFLFLNNNTNEWIKSLITVNINKVKVISSFNTMTDKVYAFHYGLCIPSQC